MERRDKVQFLNAMVFLANDLVLTDRLKKLTDGSLVHRAFERVMPQAISGFVEVGTPETVETLKRVLGIWKSMTWLRVDLCRQITASCKTGWKGLHFSRLTNIQKNLQQNRRLKTLQKP